MSTNSASNSTKMKNMKLVHTEGHTDVCYDSNGSHILTGGRDGKVCIWDGPDDTDATTFTVGDKIFTIAFQGGRFFAATEENTIRIFTYPDGVGDGMVTRFTAPARHFCLCDDGTMLVAGADDFKIKVMSMEDNECVCMYTEHHAPILSVALDPTKEFVASCSCDGTVKIWNIADGSTEKSLNLLTKCSEPSQAKSLCRMCWSEDGEFLLVPVENEIHIYLRSSWELVGKIQSPELQDVINVMSLCPNGKHIAVGCVKGTLGIFDWHKRRLSEKHVHPKQLTITSVAWNPKKLSELAFCDNMGQLGFAEVSALAQNISEMEDSAEVFDDLDEMLVSAAGDGSNDDVNKLHDASDDENSIDIGKIKQSLNSFLEDHEDGESVTSNQLDDLGSKALAPAPLMHTLPVDIFKPTPPQAPFQPGSTPEHLSSRFMVWNSVGFVRQYVSDEENTIDVEFHNTATHHALHVDNQSNFIIADLSAKAVLLASREEEDTRSKLLCMHFGSWDSWKEWSVTMEAGDEIHAITASDEWVAVATKLRIVRIFSIGGIQCQIFSLPGNVVALASHTNQLLTVYHHGMGIPGDQCMSVQLMTVRGRTHFEAKTQSLPLSPKSKLSWIGFSEEGTPFYMDYDGVVRMKNGNFGSTWCPVANTKDHVKGKSDHYWLVGMSEKLQQIRCIPCKGSRYPPTLPRPALAVLPLRLPLCDMDSEKSQYEESFQRSSLFARSLRSCGDPLTEEETQKPVREALMKLFALAAKGEREFRAVEVCEMMEDQSLLHIAATYASRLKRMQLAERVGAIMRRRQEEQDREEYQEFEEAEMVDSVDDAPTYHSETCEDNGDDVDSQNCDEERTKPSTPGPYLKTTADKDFKCKEKLSGRSNPFKKFSVAERMTKGSQVFDKMEKTTPKASPVFAPLPVSIKRSGKKKVSGQTKLTSLKNGDGVKASPTDSSPQVKQELLLSQYSVVEKSENEPVKKKISAFDLWFEANKDDLTEEFPDLSEEDIGQKATEAFRALSTDERQSWVQKAKSTNTSSVSDESKKRKLSADNPEPLKGDEQIEAKKIKGVDTSSGKKTPLSQTTNAKLAKFAKVD